MFPNIEHGLMKGRYNMKSKIAIGAVLLTAFSIILSGCNLPIGPGSNANPGAYYTQAAETIVAQLTYSVIETYVEQKTQEALVTSTPLPTFTPAATDTPTPEPTATNTPVPPTSTPIPIPCNAIQFVADVTVDDGETMSPNESFYKIWRLKNVGTCTWTKDYDLVFVSGDRMDGEKEVPLTYNVAPGNTIDVAVYLTAPDKKGVFQGFWMLRSGNGYRFGFGPYADQAFWVKINVKKSAPSEYDTPFSFYSNYCLAEWSNADQVLPCPGNSSSDAGSVIYVKKPYIEKGGQDDEPALWVRPQQKKNGKIIAEFPPILIQDGDVLTATLGCMKDATKCDVDFRIDYRIVGEDSQNLGVWNEVYDKSVTRIEEDLSFLKDEKVIFYFTVHANGSATGDDAFWMVPQIK